MSSHVSNYPSGVDDFGIYNPKGDKFEQVTDESKTIALSITPNFRILRRDPSVNEIWDGAGKTGNKLTEVFISPPGVDEYFINYTNITTPIEFHASNVGTDIYLHYQLFGTSVSKSQYEILESASNKVQTELGLDPRGTHATVRERLDVIQDRKSLTMGGNENDDNKTLSAKAIYDHFQAFQQGLSFKTAVIERQTTGATDPTATPNDKDRYLLIDIASKHANFGTINKDFNGDAVTLADDDMVEYRTVWGEFRIDKPSDGDKVAVNSENIYYVYTGTGWEGDLSSSTLVGLTDTNMTPTGTEDKWAVVWDNATNKFILEKLAGPSIIKSVNVVITGPNFDYTWNHSLNNARSFIWAIDNTNNQMLLPQLENIAVNSVDVIFDRAYTSITICSYDSVANGSLVTDPDAIHDNVAGEINAVTLKATPVSADVILGEDSANGFVKKRFDLSKFINPTPGLYNLVEDTTPQLGGVLDTNSKQVRFSKGADVTSTSSLAIGNNGNYFNILGTNTITSIVTKSIGTTIKLNFTAILTLTHHNTNFVLPTGADIVTQANDKAEFIEGATGKWLCVSYLRADGTALAGSGGAGVPTYDATVKADGVVSVDCDYLTITSALADNKSNILVKGSKVYPITGNLPETASGGVMVVPCTGHPYVNGDKIILEGGYVDTTNSIPLEGYFVVSNVVAGVSYSITLKSGGDGWNVGNGATGFTGVYSFKPLDESINLSVTRPIHIFGENRITSCIASMITTGSLVTASNTSNKTISNIRLMDKKNASNSYRVYFNNCKNIVLKDIISIGQEFVHHNSHNIYTRAAEFRSCLNSGIDGLVHKGKNQVGDYGYYSGLFHIGISDHCYFKNMHIEGGWHNGSFGTVMVSGSNHISLDNITIDKLGRFGGLSGISCWQGNGATAGLNTFLSIHKCKVFGDEAITTLNGQGLNIGQTTHLKITDCEVHSVTGSTASAYLYMTGSNLVNISGCTFHINQTVMNSPVVLLNNCYKCTVENNTISAQTQLVSNTLSVGIAVGHNNGGSISNFCIVNGNIIENLYTGIYVKAGSSSNKLTSNTSISVVVPITDLGTSTVVANNQ